jgi:hypothetical protein
LAAAHGRTAFADVRVAGPEKEASDTRAVQQRVETKMAKQQERAAICGTRPHTIERAPERSDDFSSTEENSRPGLKGAPSGAVDIWWTASHADSFGLAKQMVEIFKEAGWPPATEHFAAGGIGSGFFIAVRDHTNAPAYAVGIQNAYKLIAIDMNGFSKADVPDGRVPIYIGHQTLAQ